MAQLPKLQTTNIGLALATGADGATLPGFGAQAANQYAGMRSLAQTNRSNRLKQQTTQFNLRKAAIGQATAELEFQQKQQDRFREEQIKLAHTKLYSDLSDQFVQYNENPNQFDDKQVSSMLNGWQQLLDSDAYSSEAGAKAQQLAASASVRWQTKIADNKVEFEKEAAMGRAVLASDWESVPDEARRVWQWGRKQVGIKQDPQTGQTEPEYAIIANGINDQFKNKASRMLDKFVAGKIGFDELVDNEDVQLVRAKDEDFRTRYNNSIEDIASETRKAESDAARPSKVVSSRSVLDSSGDEVAKIQVTGNVDNIKSDLKKIGLSLSDEGRSGQDSGGGSGIKLNVPASEAGLFN